MAGGRNSREPAVADRQAIPGPFFSLLFLSRQKRLERVREKKERQYGKEEKGSWIDGRKGAACMWPCAAKCTFSIVRTAYVNICS